MPTKPRLQMFFLGGTVLMLPSKNGGIVPATSGNALLAGMPDLNARMEITSVSSMNVPSASLTLDQIVSVSRQINAALSHDFDGVVTVQGTDSIKETALSR